MYYRNANCAVVVYDITQAVCDLQEARRSPANMNVVVSRQGKVMGEGASKTGK